MAETIRDVIIRVTVQQVESNLKMPDLKPVINQEKEASKEADNLVNSVTNVTNTFDNSVTTINEAAKSFRSLGDDALLTRLRKIDESIKGIGDRSSETAQKARQVTASAFQLSSLGDKMKSGGEGALTLAKGIGFLTAANEEHLQHTLKVIAAAEGGFNAFKGGLETYKAVSELMPVIRAGIQSVTVAENARGAATAAANATAVSGLTKVALALTPLAAVAGIGTLAYVAFSQFGSGASSASKDAGGLEKQVEKLKVELMDARGWTVDPFGEIDKEIGRDAIRIAENLSTLRDGALRDRQQEIMVANDLMTQEQRLFNLESERRDLSRRFAAPGLVAEERNALIERAKVIDEQRLSILQRQGEQLKRNREEQQNAINAAREAVQQEEKRLRSLDEIVGRMSQLERMEFAMLGQKAKDGRQLNRAELGRVEELGGAGTSDFVSRQFAQLGRKEGGADMFSPFAGQSQRGSGSELERLKESLRMLTDENAGNGVADLTRQIEQNARERKQAMSDLFRALEANVANGDEVRELRAKVTALEDKVRRGRANARE